MQRFFPTPLTFEKRTRVHINNVYKAGANAGVYAN